MTALKKIKHFTYMGIACIPLDNLVVVMIQSLSVMYPFELSQKLECGGTPCCLVIFASDNEQHIMFLPEPKKRNGPDAFVVVLLWIIIKETCKSDTFLSDLDAFLSPTTYRSASFSRMHVLSTFPTK